MCYFKLNPLIPFFENLDYVPAEEKNPNVKAYTVDMCWYPYAIIIVPTVLGVTIVIVLIGKQFFNS